MERRRNKFKIFSFIFLLSILFISCNKNNNRSNEPEVKILVPPFSFFDLEKLQFDSLMNSSCPENFINSSGEYLISLYEDEKLGFISEFSTGRLIRWKSLRPECTSYLYEYDEKGELKEEKYFKIDENGKEVEIPSLSKKYVYSLGIDKSMEICEIYHGNDLYQTITKTKYEDGFEFNIKPQLGSQKTVNVFFDTKGRVDYESYSYMNNYSQTWNFIEYKYNESDKVIEIYEYLQKDKNDIDIRRCIYEYSENGNLIKQKEITYVGEKHEKQEIRDIEFSEHDSFGHWQKKTVYLNNELLFEEKRIVKMKE